MKYGTKSRSSSFIINMIFEIVDIDSNLKNLGRFGLKISVLIFMKFDTQNKSNMLIMNTLIGIDDLDPKLHPCEIQSQN